MHRFPICSAIPPHILRHAAAHGDENARQTLQTTLQYSALIAGRRKHGLFAVPQSSGAARKRRNVYSARNQRDLPGVLVLSDSTCRASGSKTGLGHGLGHGLGCGHPATLDRQPATPDAEAIEAFNGSAATYDFYATVFDRHSIDDRG